MIKGYIIEKYGVNNYSKFLFLIKGAIISIFIYLISDYTPIRIFTAKIVQKGITYFGIEKSLIISKKYVAIGNYEISKRCIGLASGAIFSALFLLSSLKLSKKILYLSLFLLILLFLNIMRLMVTIYLFEQGYSWFIAHDILAYVLGIGFSFLVLIKINPFIPLFN
ncbi:MAG TPA: archaeosortase/exosortase family protein [Methanofastidiosum sp.]|nr:archaeosortase/exosortase family protein [Methanofastidiosum sp.]HRS25487.1 archaeosortase/exosortase family protein [Methanofastidiosum sp.]